MTPPSDQDNNAFLLMQITKQLEKQDERLTRLDEQMRKSMDELRQNLVERRALDLQLAPMGEKIERVDADRKSNYATLNARVDQLAAQQISDRDRLWLRVGQIAGLVAIGITLLELLSQFKFIPK